MYLLNTLRWRGEAVTSGFHFQLLSKHPGDLINMGHGGLVSALRATSPVYPDYGLRHQTTLSITNKIILLAVPTYYYATTSLAKSGAATSPKLHQPFCPVRLDQETAMTAPSYTHEARPYTNTHLGRTALSPVVRPSRQQTSAHCDCARQRAAPS